MDVCVSIIVAIYKVADYLDICIRSILEQSYRNIDVILVDDGSPDAAPEICDKYAKLDERIRVIHKSNEGCVMARKDGLSIAHGKYTLMVDGDDWMDSHYVEKLVEVAEMNNADVVVDSYLESYETHEQIRNIYVDKGVYAGILLEQLNKKLIYSGEYFNFGINPALWNKLFLTEKLKTFYTDIPKSLTLGEDFAVSMPYMASSKMIVVIDSNAYYHYRQRENSMVNAYNPKLIINVSKLLSYLQGLDWTQNQLQQLNYYYSWIIAFVIKNQARASNSWKTRKEKMSEIYSLPNIKLIVSKLKISSIKYRFMFWCIANHNLDMLLLLLMRR